MAKLFNRARMSVTSTGTGTLTLGSAVTGYQTFASAGVANGDVVSYAIEDGVNWEIGTGTYTSSGTTLSRTVAASSNSNTAISVTTSAQVYVTALVADLITSSQTNTVAVGYTVTPNSVTTGSFTVNPALGNYQYVTNNGAYTITAPASDCAVDILVTNGASAGATTFSGFTVGSSTGSALTTTNTNKFLISVRRINSVSTYSIYALQ